MTYSNHTDTTERLMLDELLQVLPMLEHGMDVNPKFTEGITGYEYTSQLSAFDMLRVKLVHGWLMEPTHANEDLCQVLANKSYNQVVELIIQGKDAEQELSAVHKKINDLRQQHGTFAAPAAAAVAPADLLDDVPPPSSIDATTTATMQQQELVRLQQEYDQLQNQSTTAAQIENFLHHSSHQLTHYGLQVLHETLQDGEMTVFFRNNHFGTLTKQQGLLYLLATDLGYAHTPDIVWEKLDMIDGDTELVNCQFQRGATQSDLLAAATGSALSPEQLLAQSGENDADYHLALQLSMQGGSNNNNNNNKAPDSDAQEGQLVTAATEASLRDYHGIPEGKVSAGGGSAASAAVDPSALPAGVEMGVPVSRPPAAMAGGGGSVVALPPKQTPVTAMATTGPDADLLLAMQLEANHDSNEEASLRLAQQLQAHENQRATPTGRRSQRARGTASSCVIS